MILSNVIRKNGNTKSGSKRANKTIDSHPTENLIGQNIVVAFKFKILYNLHK